MILTKASEYALLSLIFIAQKNSVCGVDMIAREINISRSFLAKILQNLAKNGILNSYKGVNGGFSLAKKPKYISLKSIIECAENKTYSVFECSVSIDDCKLKKKDCKIWYIFNNLQNHVEKFLDNTNLEDILQKEELK